MMFFFSRAIFTMPIKGKYKRHSTHNNNNNIEVMKVSLSLSLSVSYSLTHSALKIIFDVEKTATKKN